MTRGHAGVAVLLACLLFGFGCAPDTEPAAGVSRDGASTERPNVVLIVVDTLRADAISPYGFDPLVSPTLTRLASEGVVFDRALAQSSWTKVSMASMLTSMWPVRHGVHGPTDGLSAEAHTIQDVLSSAGYDTYGVQSNGWLEQSFGFHHGFDRYVFPHAMSMANELGRTSVWPHGERILDESVRLLESRDHSTPFFLYLHMMDVHEYAAPPEFKRFGESQRDAYTAAISWVDDLLRRLLEKLETEGLADRTLVIFASDHAESFGENRTEGHARNVHTPVLHVPLILHMPGRIAPGRVSTQVRNLDIAPTIVDLAGLPIPDEFEGRSLVELMNDRVGADRVNFAGLGSPIMRGISEQVAINDGRYALIRTLGDDPVERLYDQELDWREDADILDLEEAEAARLRALLDAHLEQDAAEATVESDVRIDPAIANRLKAIGYLQ